MDILTINQLTKIFQTKTNTITALTDIDLTVAEGDFIAITGQSGSGKSTLLQLLGGLDRPTSGTVSIEETYLDTLSDSELSRFRNQTVGLVFQSFYLQPFLTLRRNLEVAAMPRHMPQSERTAQVTQLAEQVGLAQRLHHRPRELSGGRIQRAAIARAQACIGQPFCWK
jgi:ABC-type lipoprotein export system ATPase subunit